MDPKRMVGSIKRESQVDEDAAEEDGNNDDDSDNKIPYPGPLQSMTDILRRCREFSHLSVDSWFLPSSFVRS